METLFDFYPVQTEDRRIIKNLATAFQDNARMRALIGKKQEGLKKGIRHIVSYSYFMVKKIGGVFISEDRNTYLLYYRKSEFYFSLKDCRNYLFLAFGIVGISRLKGVYLREKRIKATRRKEMKKQGHTDYMYVWYLAQKKEHQSLKGLMEAKNFIINRAKMLQLPVYMETTEARLVKIYERIGFYFYSYEEEDTGLRVWFGRYDF